MVNDQDNNSFEGEQQIFEKLMEGEGLNPESSSSEGEMSPPLQQTVSKTEGPSQSIGPEQVPPMKAPEPSPDEMLKISEEIASQYPPPRLGTEIVLLEVDPHRAHAYWNVDVEDYRKGQADAGSEQAPFILRMHDITGVEFNGSNAQQTFDIEVQGLQSHWYVDLFQDGRTYVADLGFRRPDGSLVELARSNVVQTPNASQSAHYETAAVVLGAEEQGAPIITDLNPANLARPLIPVAENDPQPEPSSVETAEVSPSPIPEQEKEFPLPTWPAHFREEAEKAKIIAPVEPSTAIIDSERKPDSTVATQRENEGAQTPPPREPSTLPAEKINLEDWPAPEKLLDGLPKREERVQELYKECAPAESAISSSQDRTAAEVGQVPPPEAKKEPPGETPTPAPTQRVMPLENYINFSSFDVNQPNVMLEVNTEIHIYGRAKPGAELMLYGQKIPLRPDGSFSVRRPLPQGALIIPLIFLNNPNQPSGGS